MLCPEESLQETYLRVVANDIERFKTLYQGFTLLGCDIGGGTPTSLTDKNFSLLMKVYRSAIAGLELTDDFEPSVEATFDTLSEKKLIDMVEAGFKRLSLGVQSSSHSIAASHHRLDSDERQMKEWLTLARQVGIEKVNLDFMYGLQGQDEASIRRDLELIDRLHPEQMTLYELRTNMLTTQSSFSKEALFAQYSQYYEGLTSMGYKGKFGQNTFSVNVSDQGVSSYLRERMLNGASYKGFGLSAQSMSRAGVSYNLGKLSGNPRQVLNTDSYPEEYTYLLPAKELAAKYMAISAYHGSFSLKKLLEIGVDSALLNDTLDFCFSQGLLVPSNDDRVVVTKEGFEYYGAVFSLFF
jgi:oxygen-independent coproporphyrinogen-3 oxidase